MTPAAPTGLEDVRYPSPEIVECPFAFYEMFRRRAPVLPLASGTFLVSRHDDAVAVARDAETFSSLIGPRNDQILGGPRVGGDADGPWPLPFTDGEAHRRQRSFCASLVVRDRLRWYEPRVERLVGELVDDLARATGEIEFVSAFAAPLPRRVMMETFGFPRTDEADLLRWTGGQGPVGSGLASPEERAAEQRRRVELGEYLRRSIEARRREPTDDFLTEIVQLQVDRDGELDMPYLVTEVVNLFAAGNATTAHMLVSTLQLLLERPDELRRVRADHALIGPLLEESLRLESPIQWLQRIATRTTTLAGVEIPEGSLVLILWGAANRDEQHYEDADRLDLDRGPAAGRHLAFGSGRHMCVGAPLARMEGRVALGTLLHRLPHLRLARPDEPPAHIPNVNQRAPRELWLRADAP